MLFDSQNKARGAKCDFKEEPVGGEYRFVSVHNNNWTLGFNPEGRPIMGPNALTIRPKYPECFKFVKTNVTDEVQYFRRNQFDIGKHDLHMNRKQTSVNLHPNRLMRHRKKSHRHRDRRTHLQRDSAADRWVALIV